MRTMTPGTITTLGQLRPGDVGEFIDKTLSPEIGRFLVNSCIIGDCVYCLNDDRYYEGYRKVKTAVRYLGRGRIEPARIVMEGEGDRIAELEAQVRTLREACEDALKTDEQDMLYILDNGRLRGVLQTALAVTAPKEIPAK